MNNLQKTTKTTPVYTPKYYNNLTYKKGLVLTIANKNDFAKLSTDCNPEIIVLRFTNWTTEQTSTLAYCYTKGSRVFLNRTEVKSTRFPRLANDKKQQQSANNKTCQAFIKEVYKILTKAWQTDPRRYITLDCTCLKQFTDPRFPKTTSTQQAVQGIEEGLASINQYTATEEDIFNAETKLGLYVGNTDLYKHYTTTTRPEVEEKKYYHLKECKYGKQTYQIQTTVSFYKKSSYFIEETNEVYVWKDSTRPIDKNISTSEKKAYSRADQTYMSDVKEYIASNKVAEVNAIADWLAEHDILSDYAIHCPHCKNVMNVYDGCSHCGYQLPKEAISEFTNGRITENELSNMPIELIAKTFLDNDTHCSYQEWFNTTDEPDEYEQQADMLDPHFITDFE